MTVKLVMLKSGEDIIADVKEIKSEEDVTYGEFFTHPRFSCNSSSWYGREDEVEGNS